MMDRRFVIGALAAGLGLGPMGMAWAQEAGEAVQVSAIEVTDFAIGAEDAPITFVEYASFTCPHCARFHDEVFGRLKADYIDTGKVRFVYREVYFDRYGLWAAMVARCGGEMRYFGITDMLFSTQQDWAGSDDPAVVSENLRKIGRKAGMEDAAIDACMKDAAMAEALVAHFEEGMAEDDVQGTPTLIINGVKHQNMSYDELKLVLDAALVQ